MEREVRERGVKRSRDGGGGGAAAAAGSRSENGGEQGRVKKNKVSVDVEDQVKTATASSTPPPPPPPPQAQVPRVEDVKAMRGDELYDLYIAPDLAKAFTREPLKSNVLRAFVRERYARRVEEGKASGSRSLEEVPELDEEGELRAYLREASVSFAQGRRRPAATALERVVREMETKRAMMVVYGDVFSYRDGLAKMCDTHTVLRRKGRLEVLLEAVNKHVGKRQAPHRASPGVLRTVSMKKGRGGKWPMREAMERSVLEQLQSYGQVNAAEVKASSNAAAAAAAAAGASGASSSHMLTVDEMRCPRDIRRWTSDQVCQFIASLGFRKWVPLFRQAAVNGNTLLMSSDDMLREMGLSRPADRTRILQGLIGVIQSSSMRYGVKYI